MSGIGQDVRYALRGLRKSPGFTFAAVLTLALSVGATTAIFSVVNSVLLRQLPFPEPSRLTMLQPTSGSRLSPEYLHDWRLASRTFEDLAGWHDARAVLTSRGEPVEVVLDRATRNFFAVLGTPAIIGRTFTTGTNLADVPAEVVLSYRLWQQRYAGEESVIGQPITLDGETFTIVGVMPHDFAIRTNELAESRAELWQPFPLVVKEHDGMGGMLNVVGRLAPGVALDQAQAELTVITERIEEEYQSYSRNWRIKVIPLLDATVRDVRLTLLVLFGAVAVLLTTACVNVANLVLGRSAGRDTEFVIRRSLGATNGRIVRQLLAEGVVLSLIGGTAALMLAWWGTDLLVSIIPASLDLPRRREIHMDAGALLFALFVTSSIAVLLGLTPSLRSVRAGLFTSHGTTRSASANRRSSSLASTLISAQVAIAVMLLAGAGLISQSFWKLTRVVPGFQPEHVLTMRITIPASKYATDESIQGFSSELLQRIQHLPAIEAVGSVGYLPMSNVGVGQTFEIDGHPEARPGEKRTSWTSVVSGQYFDVMRIPLRRGRLPAEADTSTSEPVFVIDEELARRYWPKDDPIGARLIWRGEGTETLSGEIVGIVGGVRWGGRASGPQPTTYFWFPQKPARELIVVARTHRDPTDVASLIAAQVREIDANQPVGEVRTMQDFVAADLVRPRVTMLILGIFASTALLLAAVGLYSVISLWVTHRNREIGVRIALGAQYGDVLRLILRRGAWLIGTGLAIGIAASISVGGVISGLLFGIAANDPTTLLAVSAVLVSVATLAVYLPARRAARVDPLVALRYE